MKFIHTADIHLGAQPDSMTAWSRARADEIWESFYRLLDRAEEEQTDLLLIAGDLFHRQPLKRELKEVNYHFSKLTHTQVVAIAGNHDPMTGQSNYLDFEWAPNVAFFRKNHMSYIYLEHLNTVIYGMSYDRKEIREGLYDNVRPMKRFKDGRPLPSDAIHILLGHGGDADHIPIQMERLKRAGFDYVALGHIHKPHLYQKAAIAYAGALEPVDRGDEGEHGYMAGIIDEERTLVDFVPFAKRAYRKLEVPVTADMTGAELLDRTRTALAEAGADDIYSLILSGVRSADVSFDRDRLMQLGNILSVTDQSVPDYDYDRLYQENADNIIGMFIERLKTMPVDQAVRDKALFHGMRAFDHAQRRD